jgi:hypothetical protein
MTRCDDKRTCEASSPSRRRRRAIKSCKMFELMAGVTRGLWPLKRPIIRRWRFPQIARITQLPYVVKYPRGEKVLNSKKRWEKFASSSPRLCWDSKFRLQTRRDRKHQRVALFVISKVNMPPFVCDDSKEAPTRGGKKGPRRNFQFFCPLRSLFLLA